MQTDTQRIQHLMSTIETQFNSRTVVEARKQGLDFGISLATRVDNNNILWLSFDKEGEQHNITIPMPYFENGVQLLQQNEVVRSVCPFWFEMEQKEVDYLSAVRKIVLDSPAGLVPADLVKTTPFIQQMVYGFRNDNASIIAYRFQRAINELVNKMPLHETFMNSYIMNNRLIIIDKVFDELRSPDDRLKYQTAKAVKYFPRGWTAMGLSDGTLADKNYLLKTDLRLMSPFGWRYHNPQRNLYSTLGMKGDEEPLIRSQSMQTLMDHGIARKGWNMFTAFVDIPDIFEDQIMVDESHVDKFVTYERRFQVFGEVMVKEGQAIEHGALLGFSPDGEANVFKTFCDAASVKKVVESRVSVGGEDTPVSNIVVSYRRNFRDGFKITNLHGNKGVIRIANLGYATDPSTGKERKIDVIVGAKTVGKRKNYGQIMEALLNCVLDTDHADNRQAVVLDDDWCEPGPVVEKALVDRGYRENGTWDCDTYAGKVKAVCGTIFWGCIKTAEDQIWQDNATVIRNGKEVRRAGLKFSHVEFRSLETLFGESNPVVDEIMSYAQGTENLHEMTKMLKAKMGVCPKGIVTLDVGGVKPMDQQGSTIVTGQCLGGSVVDEYFHPDGFLFQLPLAYQTLLDEKGEVIHEGSDQIYANMGPERREMIAEVYTADKLYFPAGTLRKCWRHDTGKFGLSEIGVLVNNVVVMSHRLVAGSDEPNNYRLYFNALSMYFDKISKMMGSKRGEVSTYAMAVRYPFSAKAVATLSTTLPKNTIEIHRDMARQLRANNGDVVLTERFPCLGFMSVRPQKVRITDDPMCKYVIRVSGNSLVSQNLDFDGDVLFVAAFHSPAAKLALQKEWTNPNQTCYGEVQRLNERKGAPHVKEYDLRDFAITSFADLTNEEHAAIVEKNTGVKAQTGPVIALTYNIMRIVENSDMAHSQKMKVAVEMFLEKAAQSVFEQKHGGKSLYEIVIDGVCTADVEMLVEVGFKRGTTEKLCALIVEKARALGIFNLKKFHQKAKDFGGSNLISKIVKSQNRIYFASRSRMEGIALLKALKAPAVDIPSRMFKWVTAGKADSTKTILEKLLTEDMINEIGNPSLRDACETMCTLVEGMFSKKPSKRELIGRSIRESMSHDLEGGFNYAATGGYRR